MEYIFFFGHDKTADIGPTCLSQWYLAEFKDEKGRVYSCAEMWMMSEKARLFQDWKTLDKIHSTSDPRMHKKLGREVKGFDDKIWSEKCFDIVVQGNMMKFSQNPELKKYLMSTHPKILV